MILTLKIISGKQHKIDIDDNSTLKDATPQIIKLFNLTASELKFFFSGKQLDVNTKISELGYDGKGFIIVAPINRKTPASPQPKSEPAPAPSPATSEPAHKPAPAPAPTPAPASVQTPTPAPPASQNTSPTSPATHQMTDKEWVDYLVSKLPESEKFVDNLTELMSLGFDRDLCVRALIHFQNSLPIATNRILENNVPPLPPKGSDPSPDLPGNGQQNSSPTQNTAPQDIRRNLPAQIRDNPIFAPPIDSRFVYSDNRLITMNELLDSVHFSVEEFQHSQTTLNLMRTINTQIISTPQAAGQIVASLRQIVFENHQELTGRYPNQSTEIAHILEPLGFTVADQENSNQSNVLFNLDLTSIGNGTGAVGF